MRNTKPIINFTTPYILLSGSYENSRRNDDYCKILGFELVKYDIGVISAGGKPGLKVTSSMYTAMSDLQQYDPFKLLTYYREKIRPSFPNPNGMGSFVFIGKNIKELRDAMMGKARVLVAIGGSSKTQEEITLAERNKIPVIPIGMSGGTAAKVWLEYSLSKSFPYEDPFSRLNSKNAFVAAQATIELLDAILKHHEF